MLFIATVRDPTAPQLWFIWRSTSTQHQRSYPTNGDDVNVANSDHDEDDDDDNGEVDHGHDDNDCDGVEN